MYLYIYDSFLNDKKYTDLLIKIEQRITDLGIKGRITKLSILKNMKELITDGVKEGVKTVVVIGNNQTFAKVINIVADLDVVLGIIPIEKSKISTILGIPTKIAACEVLASRIIKQIDLGKINNQYFIHSAEINNSNVVIEYNNFKVQPATKENQIVFYNFADENSPDSSPVDGKLEAVISPVKSNFLGKKKSLGDTILPFSKIKITSQEEEQVSILTDEQIIMKTPAKIIVAPEKLSIIVGPDRTFD